MSSQVHTYSFKIFSCVVMSKPHFNTWSTYSKEQAYKNALYMINQHLYEEITVKNAIHMCRYTASDFCKRYEAGQRNFIKSNHPTFERWRPKRKEKKDVQ